jgi:HK97 family phage major capsid protein
MTMRTAAAEILELGTRHGALDLAHEAIAGGASLPTFRQRLTARLVGRELGGAFSFRRMFAGMQAGHLDGLEREVLEQSARDARENFDPQRVRVPWALFGRDLTAATANAGGYLVATDVGAAVDVLRPWSVTARAGLTFLEGLVGNLTLPRTTARVTAQWLATEATAATESQPTLGSIAMAPKFAAGYVEYSRQLDLQGPVEQYVRNELLRTVGTLIDAAVINGTGNAGQPLGLLNTAGLGSQSGASLAWSGVLNMKETVATANGNDAATAFLTTPAVREILEAREMVATSGRFVWAADEMAGRPGFVSTDVPAATLIAGDFSRIVLALWGTGPVVEVNPYANFAAGIRGARLIVACDVAVTHATAFCVATSVT